MKSTVRSFAVRFGLFIALLGVVLALGGVVPSVGEEQPTVVNVWPGQPPGSDARSVGAEKIRDGKHGAYRDRFLTNITRPTLTIFRPTAQANGTAVVICPGGGYSWLAWDREGERVATWLNSLGITGIVLKYRVSPAPGSGTRSQPPPEPLQDAQRALSLVRAKAPEWNLDPSRIGIMGFSAGGHLAASAATSFDHRTYPARDAVDAASCRPDFAVLVYPAYLITGNDATLVPTIHVRRECPPTFLVHAGDDHVPVMNSVVFYQALKRAGVPAELHVYATGGHGFGVGSGVTASWPTLCAEWMRRQGWLHPASGR